MNFTAEKSREGTVHILALSGDIDYFVGEAFEACLADAIRTATSPLVVDLSGVRYLDSFALGRLMKAHKTMAARGDYFGIVMGGGMVARLFEIAGVGRTMSLHRTLESAVAAAQAASS